ncbi:SprT family zinc-dependent metalloprotease [Hyphomicrobium sp.]|uniref:M48 family metallopeptidase n=1 Tax=Hyphomicrobium sp. TaxID=82 RepID=UPI002E32A100|nr:SprT family zinc-dependent metalloprotease [Hyphomicrobium sp.]HEX2839851.1 SprT family zinc-dependent metalloprotease [Hyphomicrobium sp.]
MRKTRTISSPKLGNEKIDSLGAPVEVRRHPGARRLTLRVSRTRRAVIVTLPVQCDLDEAGSFITRNIEWVREHLNRLPSAVPFIDGVFIPLRGEAHRVVFAGPHRRGVVERKETASYPELHVYGRAEHAPRRLKDWLAREAHRDLAERVAIHAKQLGVAPKRIAVRDQTSRWGSCSTTGVLSFSWRLIMAPSEILDYVAAHEVAHLREMNHGPRFWALVAKTMPSLDEAKKWLQIYGMDLHRYGDFASETR